MVAAQVATDLDAGALARAEVALPTNPETGQIEFPSRTDCEAVLVSVEGARERLVFYADLPNP